MISTVIFHSECWNGSITFCKVLESLYYKNRFKNLKKKKKHPKNQKKPQPNKKQQKNTSKCQN